MIKKKYLLTQQIEKCAVEAKDEKDAARLTPVATATGTVLRWDLQTPKNYLRVTWDISWLIETIDRLKTEGELFFEIDFGAMQINLPDIEWIALLKRDPEKGKVFFRKLWANHRDTKGVPSVFTESAAGFAALETLDSCFELTMHLRSVSGDICFGSVQINLFHRSWLSVTKAEYVDFRLDLRGFARNSAMPGMPVRVQLGVGDRIVAETWARSGVPKGMPSGFFAFTFEVVLLPDDLARGLYLLSPDIGQSEPIEPCMLTEAEAVASTDLGENAPVDADEAVVGKVERVIRHQVYGWAMCETRPEAAVDIALYVDGRPLMALSPGLYREDVQNVRGGTGKVGFSFNLPPNLATARSIDFEVRPVKGRNKIKNAHFTLEPLGLAFASKASVAPTYHIRAQATVPEPISLVVLNCNGAALLDDLFTSAFEQESPELLEWIVVDHGSTDESFEVCETAIARGQRVTVLRRGSNFSFSNSSNYGVARASHDIIVLANNDMLLRGSVVTRLRAALADTSVGVVGARLFDYSDTAPTEVEMLQIVQHLGVHISPRTEGPWIRAFDGRLTNETASRMDQIIEVPIVTGAFLAMRKADYTALGGLDENYLYGLEDVALCLAVRYRLGLSVICDNTLKIAHHRGFTRDAEVDTTVRRRNNNNRFNADWGNLLRTDIKIDMFTKLGFWQGTRPVVAFAVADAGDSTTAGEYFTALELGRAMQKIAPVHLRFVTRSDWQDLREVDLLITMVSGFNLHSVKEASPFLRTVCWTRQWFDKWTDDVTLQSYDLVLASSEIAADHLAEAMDAETEIPVLPIASNTAAMQTGIRKPLFECDYCFNGNKVGTTREIEFSLVPNSINGIGAVFGSGWEDTPLAEIARGHVAYSNMADIYASTKIVIDDANIATKHFGSCNSRIFDAIAAGCLVVTNGAKGVQALFGDLVPTYSTQEDLTEVLNYWLEHEQERYARVSQLQEIVSREHSYDRRAEKLLGILKEPNLRPRVAIKCSAPFAERMRWGDHHFACALARALRKRGFTVRVDYRETWDSGLAQSDDAVIVLRGLYTYKPKPHQKNYIWVISHPGAVTLDELSGYDRIYAASNVHAEQLSMGLGRTVEPLLQCTDPSFVWDGKGVWREAPPLFIGNSRGVYRNAVRFSAQAGHKVDIYGFGWEQFLAPECIKGEHVPNSIVPTLYCRAQAVLCDHYDDMRRLGYLSNRAFDVLAAGGLLVTDTVEGQAEILPEGGYYLFETPTDLNEILGVDLSGDTNRVAALERSTWVAENHTFTQRSEILAKALAEDLDPQKMAHQVR